MIKLDLFYNSSRKREGRDMENSNVSKAKLVIIGNVEIIQLMIILDFSINMLRNLPSEEYSFHIHFTVDL